MTESTREWEHTESDAAPLGGIDEYDDSHESLALFEGDTGTLTLAERQCLLALLKFPIVTPEKYPHEWATLLESQYRIRERMNDLLLDLIVDMPRGAAYKVQVRSDRPGEFPPLLKDSAYTREETILLIYVRQRHFAESQRGAERVYVETRECLDAVEQKRPANATDVSGNESSAVKAIESLAKSRILIKSGDKDRYLVSPVIEALLPLDTLKTLVEWFADQNNPNTASAAPEAENTEDGGEE